MNVVYVAERVGNAYRGEAVDGRTFETKFKTPHTYPTPAVAQQAALRMFGEKCEGTLSAAVGAQ
jgi:hypothetical protein